MTRHDFGFALTLALLLLAPELPYGDRGVSLALVGCLLWLLLSFDLPIKRFIRMPALVGVIGFSIYALLISFVSLRPDAIIYAIQFAAYVLLGAMLLPAYLCDADRRRRAWRIFAAVGGIYSLALVASLWTGPVYPWQVSGTGKAYYDIMIRRGFGFSESTNAAGGIAAVLACFTLFAAHRGRLRLVLVALAVAGVLAPMSRSAMIAFVAALIAVAAIVALRPLVGTPVSRPRLTLRMGTVVFCSAIPLITAAMAPVVDAWEPAAQRLFLDDSYRTQDISLRLGNWHEGLSDWTADDGLARQMFGSGFRSGGFTERRAVYDTSHNAYIEILLDFGVVGLLLFGTLLLVTMTRFVQGLLAENKQPMLAFAVAGLSVLIVHNLSEVFFWRPDHAMLLVLLLTCGEIALRLKRRDVVVCDRYPMLPAIDGLGATAGDLIPGDPYGISGRREALQLTRRRLASKAA